MIPSSSSSSTSTSTSSLNNDNLDQVTFGLNSRSPPISSSSQPNGSCEKLDQQQQQQNNETQNLKSSLSSSSSSVSSNTSSRSSKSYNSTTSSTSSSKTNTHLVRISSSRLNIPHILHSNTTCALCNKRLSQPKLLNCLHTFCKPCLNALNIKNSGDASPSPPKSIMCPTCEQETAFVHISNSNLKGVDTLDDDYVMQNQLDMMDIEEMSLDCTSCKTKEKAVARCADCAQFLCTNCVQAHQFMRCFESHNVVYFEDIKKMFKVNVSRLGAQQQKTSNEIGCDGHLSPRSQSMIDGSIQIDCGVPIHKPLFCKSHPKENLKCFCNTCQTPICSDCVTTLHPAPHHFYERITDNELVKHVEELGAIMRKAKENVNFCNGEYKALDSYLTELQEQLENSRSLIEETFQSYKVILEKKKVREKNTFLAVFFLNWI
jgi:tripartite motif-containing protein 2/3